MGKGKYRVDNALSWDENVLARFVPRSGESRDDVLSWELSVLRGPAMLERCVDDDTIYG